MPRRIGIGRRIVSSVASMLLAFLLLLSRSPAQQVSFQKLFDRSAYDMSFCVRQTADSGYIVAGQWEHGAAIIKTNRFGDTLWTCTVPYPVFAAFSVVVTDSGEYVFAGGSGFCIFKVTMDGNLQWTKRYVGSDGGRVVMAATMDGGFILAGARSSPNIFDAFFLKLDHSGDSVWARAFSGSGPSGSASVAATSDSGCVVVGTVGNTGPFGHNVVLIRLTSRGDTLWTRSLMTNADSYASSVQQTPDGGFIVAGSIFVDSEVGVRHEGFLAKTNSDGDTVWTKRYVKSRAYDVMQTRDGGYAFAGLTLVQDTLARPYLLKTNAQGDTLWSRQFFGLNIGMATSVQQTFDDGYVLTGSTSNASVHPTSWDIFLVKTDGSGLVSVDEGVASPVRFHLLQNYPNPFNPSTEIRYSLVSPSHVRLKVYDMLGREVATLVDERMTAGNHGVLFDARNLSSGVYMYRLTSENGYFETRKMILIK